MSFRDLIPFVLSACLAWGAPSPGAAAPPMSEAAVKAAFVYNFTKFVEWPGPSFSGPDAPLRICLLGEMDAFLLAMSGIDGKQAQGREIRVERVARSEATGHCHVLVVSAAESRRLEAIVRLAQRHGSLTVGEADNFLDAGGVIGLRVVEDRVRFDVNLAGARQANLRLSSQLLKLAREVRKD